ncbi:MAG: ATP-dependent Clp protease ATP-binding subunit [Eubacteriaceae bacterium]|nr:ATP-dependent Clp protease ATP-binding subunit [Eubacteriaceae bacterium]
MSGFERYTPKAYDIMFNITQKEAKKQGHELIGTEHLLLAILIDNDNTAAQALNQLGVTYDVTLESILALVGKQETDSTDYRLPYSARMKSVCEMAVIESNMASSQYIGPEHLLLGLIREGEGIAAQVLNDFGINKDYTSKLIEKITGISPMMGEETGPGPSEQSYPNQHQHQPKQQQVTQQQGGKSKMVEKFGKDLTKLAAQNTLDPVIGREKEIERVIQILSRRTKNNPCLIGEPGVGKTAIAEGLAQRIVEGTVPETIKHKKVVALDLSGMIAGTKYRGEFEERLKGLVDEIIERKDVILFIDEFHTIIGAGAAEGAMDAANILKPSLARGEIQAIGATTLDEYRKHIEKDAALERRFQPVKVEEPTEEEAILILFGLRDRYEAHHKLQITDDAIVAAVQLSARYLSDRFLPDKAIDLMDEAASRVKISQLTAPPEIMEMEKEVAELEKMKVELISNQKYEEAAKVRDKQKPRKEELAKLKEEWSIGSRLNNSTAKVTEHEIAHILASWTNIPVSKIKEEESEKLLMLEETLHKRVIGQDEAVTAVTKAVRRSRVGLKDPNRPIGSFIFLGPTGVGKTELCKALAEAVFGQESAIVRFDMSEYMEKHAVARLIGAPPGYVGYDEGGQLTEKVRRNAYSVVLFDEIEKAHPDIFNILLQILDDGRITDGQGKTVDFKNTIVIMTSNVGAQTIRKTYSLGFGVSENAEQDEYEYMKENVLEELRQTFKPEFLNRLDEIIVFRKLKESEISDIIDVLLDQFSDRVKPMEISLDFTDAFKEFIAKKGTNLEYGARPLKRTIQKELEDNMSEEMLKGNISNGDHIKVDAEEDTVVFTRA